MLTARHLATLATALSDSGETSLAALGATVFNDHRFFKRLIDGRDCTTESAVRATTYFTRHWPDDVPWPDSVPARPDPREAA